MGGLRLREGPRAGHYEKLRQLYATHAGGGGAKLKAKQELAFHAALFAMLLRYKSVGGGANSGGPGGPSGPLGLTIP